ncbi:MAG: hypothetical protein HRT74_01735 [Flavobacteriales bacterium]|nr:hypothetical protein [Flavobacteriales bacterium]
MSFFKKHRNSLMMAAAVLIGIALVSYVVLQIEESEEQFAEIQMEEYNPKVAAQQTALEEQVSLQTNAIDIHAHELKEELEILKKLEEEYRKLDEHFKNGRINEKLLQSLMNNYKHRLQVLQTMSMKLQIIKHSKETHHNETT